jgi:hypothetical protein
MDTWIRKNPITCFGVAIIGSLILMAITGWAALLLAFVLLCLAGYLLSL